MAQSGYVNLVNGTPHSWQLIGSDFQRMKAWEFPPFISPGESTRVYVSWSVSTTEQLQDEIAWSQYQFFGTESTFKIIANGDGDELSLVFLTETFAVDKHPIGSTIPLGFLPDGTVNWILSGSSSPFSGTAPSPNWMQENLAIFGDLNLRQLCLPGSHDSGMGIKTGGTLFGTEGNSLTQTHIIADQLNLGCRIFDLRPVISDGRFVAGHYSFIQAKPWINTWQGSNGEFLDDIIAGINAFTDTNSELILLNVSHARDTDTGNEDYPSLNQDQWNVLLQQLSSINHLFVSDPSIIDLTTLPLKKFITGHAAVIVVAQPEDGITLGPYLGKGFYTDAQCHYNSAPDWSPSVDTEDPNVMSAQCLTALKQKRPDPSQPPCGLGWTLTQSEEDAIRTALGLGGNTILDLAALTKPIMVPNIWGACSNQTYPNAINVDAFEDGTTALAIAINKNFALQK